MNRSYLLDTNVFLALIRGQALGARIDEAFGLRASLHRHVVSIVTRAELLVIAERNHWGSEKRATLERALEDVVVVPIDGSELVHAYVAISAAGSSSSWRSAQHGQERHLDSCNGELPLLTTDKDFRFLNGNSIQVL